MKQIYDVIVVGSGAGGGMSSYVLAQAGMKVLMLEAGRDYDPISESATFHLPKDVPLRGHSTPDKPYGFYDATVGGGWQVPNEPYTLAEGTDFMVASPHAGRAHQSLGSHFIALWSLRLQAIQP